MSDPAQILAEEGSSHLSFLFLPTLEGIWQCCPAALPSWEKLQSGSCACCELGGAGRILPSLSFQTAARVSSAGLDSRAFHSKPWDVWALSKGRSQTLGRSHLPKAPAQGVVQIPVYKPLPAAPQEDKHRVDPILYHSSLPLARLFFLSQDEGGLLTPQAGIQTQAQGDVRLQGHRPVQRGLLLQPHPQSLR